MDIMKFEILEEGDNVIKIDGAQVHVQKSTGEYFVYFLIVVERQECVKASGVQECFEVTNLTKYSNIPSYLSRVLWPAR